VSPCVLQLVAHIVQLLIYFLQCVAVCCSVLQCVAVRCRVLQCGVVCCSVQLPMHLNPVEDRVCVCVCVCMLV